MIGRWAIIAAGGGGMDQLEQAQAAAARYRDTEDERRAITHRLDVEGHPVSDSEEQIELRASRLVEAGLVPVEALMTAVRSEPATARVVLERIIGEHNELQPVTFLTRGARVARTVGRVSLRRAGRLVPIGTGFLVAPRLLLTNNHVLSDARLAGEAVIEFDCDPGTPDARFVLVATAPHRLFVTDEHLDFSLVALEDLPDGRAPGDEFGWNELIARQGKIVTGEPVNVVGHPMGRTKEVSLRNNRLSNQLEHFLHYETDTEPGSSGSPVFNDAWEVVALHHAGVPSTDPEGRVLKANGQLWHRSEGDQAIDWVANEGTRVSVLLDHLSRVEVPADRQPLLASLSEPSIVAPPVDARALVDGRGGEAEPTTPTGSPPHVEGGGRGVRPVVGTPRTGVRAAGGPYGGEVQLVFVHGRSQQGRDPVLLRSSWTAGLAKGLVRAGLATIDAGDVWFPFYGDTLVDALPLRESILSSATDLEVAEALAPSTPEARGLYESLLDEAATAAGMPAELRGEDVGVAPDVAEGRLVGGVVSRLQRQLTWLANRSGLDDVVIARAFRDVAAYLDTPEIRTRVLDEVLTTVPDRGPVVLVCHSLGTVVGMDLLTRLPEDIEVRALVTAGSPLGMDSVHRRLLVGGPHLPDRVANWLNAWCSADAVAIGCPLAAHWGRRVVEVATDNPKDRAHDIEEYLADGRVARAIGGALRLGR
jgi:endonuclease G, mitochondrial